MKVDELFEGKLRRGRYDIGYSPTSLNHGLQHFYNNVLPALSRTFDIPTVNFKAQSDHGFGFSEARHVNLYSTERGIMRVVLRKKGLDIDLIKDLLPKALKAELSKQLVDVKVSDARIIDARETASGKKLPPALELRFSTKYPQQWIDSDKQRYGIEWK